MPPMVEWVGETPIAIEKLTARGPVLLHFFCAGHDASVRTLPYVQGWHERYGDVGLTVLGVDSPRFALSAGAEKLAAALGRLGLTFPVAADAGFDVWRSYGCEGWPSTFVWGQGGTLRWFQFGEGEYAATEEAIRTLLPAEAREAGLAEAQGPLRPSDAAGARVVPPTPEVFPGGEAATPLRVGAATPAIELTYAGTGASAAVDGRGRLEVRLDGGSERVIDVTAPGVYELSSHPRHGEHRLALRASAGLEVYCVAFAPGLP